MTAKQIITLIIIIAALAIAGIFAYKFLMGTVTEEDAAKSQEQGAGVSVILPQGSELDFEKVKEFNPSGRLYTYPAVQPSDAGLPLNDLISPQ